MQAAAIAEAITPIRVATVPARVDQLREHFTDPAIVRGGRYLAPTAPGFSAWIDDEALARYAFPDGPEWRVT